MSNNCHIKRHLSSVNNLYSLSFFCCRRSNHNRTLDFCDLPALKSSIDALVTNLSNFSVSCRHLNYLIDANVKMQNKTKTTKLL